MYAAESLGTYIHSFMPCWGTQVIETMPFQLTLPRFYVHQIDVNFLMNGGRNEQEARCTKSAVYE
jgi:hypothetical protein